MARLARLAFRLGAAALAVAWGLPGQAADAPAGIVMAASGNITPPIAPMTEISGDTRVQVEPGGVLTFLHYGRCKLVTVTGGTVAIDNANYRTTGRVEKEADGPCPKIYALNEATGAGRSTGTLVVRGVDRRPQWPVNPEILLTGPRAGDVRAAAVYNRARPDHPWLHMAVAGRRATLLSGEPAMAPNAAYVLRLVVNNRPQPIDVPFIGVSPTQRSSLVVLRVE